MVGAEDQGARGRLEFEVVERLIEGLEKGGLATRSSLSKHQLGDLIRRDFFDSLDDLEDRERLIRMSLKKAQNPRVKRFCGLLQLGDRNRHDVENV